ncbi:sulfite exporter TauE/SafE family protein [Flaviaesturariibacter aridisoli]|uniref:Probable membrane transporter protein n=1 Tax=Flaviaesturariibacter aridisoli TaxID=2545761 RepID=A0A4R4E345_9BACT|nr:sulfite exporter TauE/SafE family protein [Flaviaesturariibacter aridisoli]TCZ73337.1 sulfite exporter TauE/SafE family protein [Flaviaesturariibacter aridisoli]
MALLGYFASLLIGVSLGLIGGGGSILTVPVLVYLFGLNPLLATSYSLFLVGATSFVGALDNFRKGWVHLKAVALFGSSSLITVFATRRFLVPSIPGKLAQIGKLTLTSSLLTMLLFALLMLLASVSMIRGRKNAAGESECSDCFTVRKLLGYGVGIGLVTGLLGAGGGFLLIPALVLLLRLPMKMAVGTSLLIIALNALIGFAGDLGHVAIDWGFLLRITTIAVAGIFLGGALGKKIAGERLKRGFGWFVLLMGAYILVREILLP